jgi:serine/threonine-protein kinase
VDARSDLYALGCVLYELLTGTPPFAADSPVAVAARHVSEPPEPPSRRNPQVGAALEALVLTALAKRPAERYQTTTAMAADLQLVADGHTTDSVPLPADPAGPPTDRLASPAGASGSAPTVVMAAPRGVRRPGRRRWALAVAAGVVALLAVALWLGDDAPTGRQPSAGAPTPSSPATTSPAPTTPPTQPRANPSAVLATLTEAVTTGQQQGTVDKGASDLLKQAQEVLRALPEGKAEDARKKLDDLQRKTDELIQQGKIRGAATDRVRQAVTQFSNTARTG